MKLAALSTVNVHHTCMVNAEMGADFDLDAYGFEAFLFTWITNVWATSMMFKAWCAYTVMTDHS